MPQSTPLLTARNPHGGPYTPYYTLHCVRAGDGLTFRIYERDDHGYAGLCSEFSEAHFADAVQQLLSHACIYLRNLRRQPQL